MKTGCEGQHNIFVADVIGVESEGHVFVLALCRHCDEFNVHKVEVATPGSPIRLLMEAKNKEQ